MLHALLSSKSSKRSNDQEPKKHDDLKTGDSVPQRARLDFQAGAYYGNEMARQEYRRTDPYAQLCNAMMKQVMGAYQSPKMGQEGKEERSGLEGVEGVSCLNKDGK